MRFGLMNRIVKFSESSSDTDHELAAGKANIKCFRSCTIIYKQKLEESNRQFKILIIRNNEL